jgi:uncharacterized protein with GYD domain
MPTYITYVKTTAKGAETLKDTPGRITQANEWIQKAGGRVIGAYATLGRYDYIWITEFPDSRAAWTVLPKVAMQGAVSTETVEALPVPEFLQMVAQA